ncbi:phospholipase D family protein [Vibrio mexicanus]|uniref:phospholipase D family protein n=1 Tax=Vibrio mexicanus TaxID=1004326 RepID=UPI00063CE0BA|nr:phospholipase D family protein [Vibrio mexicanus]
MVSISRIALSVLLAFSVGGCSFLPEEILHDSASNEQATSTQDALSNKESQTALSELAHLNWQQHQVEQSSVQIQDSGWDALAQRLALIETAQKSIDIQYYIWNSDHSGHYLAKRLLAAADRGVHVRVMLDDINLNEREDLLTALDSHPNAEIRIFNPTPSRSGVSKWLSFLGDFSRLNRRMHNKSFTVDGAFSVVGGRNIGDEYFDLSDEINFRDRDVLVAGAVVEQISDNFDKYWDSRWSYPVTLLGGEAIDYVDMINAVEAPAYANYPALPANTEQAKQLLGNVTQQMKWVDAYFVSDEPVPEDEGNTDVPKQTAVLLAKLAQQSQQEVLLESAYLVFDDRQLAAWQDLVEEGVVVKAFTNSMESNDLVTNHSAYAGRRKDMLEHGIELFELKPDSDLCQESTKDESKCAPAVPYGLHSKSAVFDRKVATIGSFNFNLRSTYLNTESVLVIEDEEIAASLADDIDEVINEEHSWHLELVEGKVRWYSEGESWTTEPEVGRWQRFQSRFYQLLPIEKYL